MTAEMTVSSIAGRFEAGIAARSSEWSLSSGETRALDVVNHVLRCVLQLGVVNEYLDEFEALAAAQREDGGWPDLTSGRRSGVRNTCFSARNLIRLNRLLGREEYATRVARAVAFVVGEQGSDGAWPDPVWGSRDATSSGMGLLLYAIREELGGSMDELHRRARECLERAARHLVATQADDGSWHAPSSYEQPVGPTAHLLPKLVLYAGERTPAVAAAIDFFVAQQEEDGSWDRQHVDHTCDATRALLLTASVIDDPKLDPVIDAGVRWLTENANPDGLWSEHPGEESSLLLTCDVLDCFSKFEAYRRAVDLRSFWE